MDSSDLDTRFSFARAAINEIGARFEPRDPSIFPSIQISGRRGGEEKNRREKWVEGGRV